MSSMQTKKIYFVQHGESQDDLDLIEPRSDTPLSEMGRDQATLLAGRFSHTPFDIVISSPLERAKETAEFIALASGKNIVYEDTLQEIKSPSVLEGVSQINSDFDSIRDVLYEKWHLPAWHYQDEENFTDAKKRALTALRVLQERPEQRIVVVSHMHFLTMLFLVMALGKLVTAEEYQTFDAFSYLDSTAITLCELTDKGWKMRTWNDITHLTVMIN